MKITVIELTEWVPHKRELGGTISIVLNNVQAIRPVQDQNGGEYVDIVFNERTISVCSTYKSLMKKLANV